MEPIQTHRGHTAPITSLLVIPATLDLPAQIISTSLDSTIRVWSFPQPDHALYAPYDPETHIQTLEGHTEAVWDLLQVKEGWMMSASSDGGVKTWKRKLEGNGTRKGLWKLISNVRFDKDGGGGIPTCLGNGKEGVVLVGLDRGGIRGIDDSGREVISTWGNDEGMFSNIRNNLI